MILCDVITYPCPRYLLPYILLTHCGRVTHICVDKLTIISSDNGLSPGWRQAIIWTNAGILLDGPLRANVNEILIKIYTFSFKKMHLKMLSGKWWPFCLGLYVIYKWNQWYKGWYWTAMNYCSIFMQLTGVMFIWIMYQIVSNKSKHV